MHRIFVVEDNPGDLLLLEEAFVACDYDIRMEVAADGSEGLRRLGDLARDHRLPELIVLNVNLPKISGHRLLRLLKEDPAFAGVPIVMLTSSSEDCDRDRCRAADDYVIKSGTWDELVAVARRLGSRLIGLSLHEPCD